MNYKEHMYKAKTVKGGNWIYGDLIHGLYNTVSIGYRDDSGLHELYVDKDTVCQYIEVNGQKFWENDIVQFDKNCIGCIKFGSYKSEFDPRETEHYGFYIEWIDVPYFRKDIGYWTKEEKIKVIGNIFDNAELITK